MYDKEGSDNWYQHGPGGVPIAVSSPVNQEVAGTDEIEIAVGDLDPIGLNGGHFGRVVRRGMSE